MAVRSLNLMEGMMNKPKQPTPDPATTYERAKPEEQSPNGKLDQPPAPKSHSAAESEKNNESPNTPRPHAESSNTSK